MTITLRPYQTQAVEAVLQAWQQHSAVLLAMATGLGKTETFLAILAHEYAAARRDGRPFRAVILAHRDELITQPVDRIALHWSDRLPTPGVVMAARDDHAADLIVATVQTLAGSANNQRRLDRILRPEYGPVTHLVIDEAHHAVAASYRRVIDRLTAANPALRHVGVTATPKRSDEAGLRKIYNVVAFRASLFDAIKTHNALAPFVGIGFELPVDLSDVTVTAGDYDVGELDRLMAVDNVNEIIVEKWLDHARLPDGTMRPTMAFTAGVHQAYALAAAFNAAGIVALAADGTTPRDRRAALLAEFRDGRAQVLVNCALWTEGLDAPSISCVIMARPTRSDLVYLQAVGRGLRLYPGKTDCLILDFAPMNGRDLIMSGDLLGDSAEVKAIKKRATEAGIVLDVFGLKTATRGIDADPDDLHVTTLDYFGRARVQWTIDGVLASCGLDANVTLCVIMPQSDRMETAERLRAAGEWSDRHAALYEEVASFQLWQLTKTGQTTSAARLLISADWGEVQDRATALALASGAGLGRKGGAWRDRTGTPGQLNFAARLGIAGADKLTRGQLAQAITHKLALAQLMRIKALR